MREIREASQAIMEMLSTFGISLEMCIRDRDITGRICGGLEVAVKRTANQGVLAKFEFPIYEKGDE